MSTSARIKKFRKKGFSIKRSTLREFKERKKELRQVLNFRYFKLKSRSTLQLLELLEVFPERGEYEPMDCKVKIWEFDNHSSNVERQRAKGREEGMYTGTLCDRYVPISEPEFLAEML